MLRNFFFLLCRLLLLFVLLVLLSDFIVVDKILWVKNANGKKVAEHSSNDFIFVIHSLGVFLPLLSRSHSVMILLPPVCVFRV